MKTLVLISAFVFSSLCLADGPANNALECGESCGHSPFEKLEHFFNHGHAASLEDFNFYDASTTSVNSRSLTCINLVKKDTTRDQVAVSDRIPFLMIGKIQAGHFSPGNGPLFPPKPDHDLDRRAILWWAAGGRESQGEIGNFIADNKIFLHEGDDELFQDEGERTRETFRRHEGMIVIQTASIDDKGQVTDVSAYQYCWSNPPAPQPEPQPQPMPQHRRGD